jgi:hypothetical protein
MKSKPKSKVNPTVDAKKEQTDNLLLLNQELLDDRSQAYERSRGSDQKGNFILVTLSAYIVTFSAMVSQVKWSAINDVCKGMLWILIPLFSVLLLLSFLFDILGLVERTHMITSASRGETEDGTSFDKIMMLRVDNKALAKEISSLEKVINVKNKYLQLSFILSLITTFLYLFILMFLFVIFII